MKNGNTALVIALTAIACTLITAITLVVITVDQSEIPEGWMALFLAALTGVIGNLATLGRAEQINRKVDHLSNGLMDDKINRGVHQVLDERDERENGDSQ